MGDFVGVDPANLRQLADRLRDLAATLAKDGRLIKSLMDEQGSRLDCSQFASQSLQNGDDSRTLGKRADLAIEMERQPHFANSSQHPYALPGWGTIYPAGTNGPFAGNWASGTYTVMSSDLALNSSVTEGAADGKDFAQALKNPRDPASQQIFKEVAQSVADFQNDPAYIQAYLRARGVPNPQSGSATSAASDAALLDAARAAGNQNLLNQARTTALGKLDDPQYADALAKCMPVEVNAWQGFPSVDADKLNRIQLKNQIDSGLATPAEQSLWTHISDPNDIKYSPQMLLLGFDGIGNGHAAVSYGNPDTAANTVVYVPGTTATLAKAAGDLGRAKTLWQQTMAADPGHPTASIYWLGYDAPGWTTPDPNGGSLPGPTGRGFADDGAPLLAAFVNELHTTNSGPDNFTVLGHSYGSTVVGDAFANFGMKADNAVFVGSPGVTVQQASDLHLDPSHVWAGKFKFDPIPDAPSLDPLRWADDHSVLFGNDPTSTAFGGQTFDSGDDTKLMAHSDYWNKGTASLANMTKIVIGDSKDVSQMPTDQQIGTVPNLDPLNPLGAETSLAGSALQYGGHYLGDWGAPIEHTGDAIQAVSTAESNLYGSAGDLLTGDFSGAWHSASDVPGDLWSGTKSLGSAVGDLFSW